jgi:restriction endonuclease S subunit
MNLSTEKAEPLPPNWKRMKLGDKALIPQGSVGNSEAVEKLKSTDNTGTIPLIHSGDLTNEKTIKIKRYVTEETYNQYKDQITIAPNKDEQDVNATFTKGTIANGKGTVLLVLVRRGVGNVGILEADRAMYNNALYAMRTDLRVLLPDLLFYFLKQADVRAYLRADLKAGRQYVRVEHVKTLEIPFPEARDQQERLLLRIEGLLAQVKAAQRIAHTNREYIDALLESMLRDIFTDERMREWRTSRLADHVTFKDTQDLYQPEYAGVPWIAPDDIDTATAHLALQSDRVNSNTTQQGVALARDPNALVYAAENRRQQRPACLAMPYRDLSQVHELSPDLLRCDADFSVFTVNDPSQLQPRFLFWFLLFSQVMPAAGTSSTARAVHNNDPDTFKASTLAYPDLAQQERISAYLDALREELIFMKAQQVVSQEAIEQMEDSILAQAFRGEL